MHAGSGRLGGLLSVHWLPGWPAFVSDCLDFCKCFTTVARRKSNVFNAPTITTSAPVTDHIEFREWLLKVKVASLK